MAELPPAEHIDAEALAKEYLNGSIDLICVLGPTASGKTKYAVRLARGLEAACGRSCEIISADSRQVYRGMDIGTGKDLADYCGIPYHLIDIADAGSQYNVFQFQQDFSAAWQDIRSRGCIPILCGGTGLYIRAVTSAYDFRSSRPLSAPGPDSEATLDLTNGSKGLGPAKALPASTYFIGTLVTREVRNERIDRRLDARLQEGMVDEIRGLLDAGVPAETLISYGLEYKFVTLYIKGELSYAQMREQLAIAIHQFAKRQMTWFRGMERSGTRIHWTEV
ncbi:MAG: tRNA dimethylallyltransferase [Bacteroidales bacterium]|nr:tRNA dimethylallyltransferase [Candidatus Cryptobacteroides equifaecalis]